MLAISVLPLKRSKNIPEIGTAQDKARANWLQTTPLLSRRVKSGSISGFALSSFGGDPCPLRPQTGLSPTGPRLGQKKEKPCPFSRSQAFARNANLIQIPPVIFDSCARILRVLGGSECAHELTIAPFEAQYETASRPPAALIFYSGRFPCSALMSAMASAWRASAAGLGAFQFALTSNPFTTLLLVVRLTNNLA
jgi:hypothetical protein